MSELFREALRRYMVGDAQWNSLLTRTRAKGKALGISSEADVERRWMNIASLIASALPAVRCRI